MIRTLFALVLVAGLSVLASGCSKKEASSAPASGSSPSPSSGNPLTAPVDYLGAVANAQKSAAKTVSTVGLNQAIKLFYAQEGRFPKALEELIPGYTGSIPPAPQGMKYQYDAQTGDLKVVPK